MDSPDDTIKDDYEDYEVLAPPEADEGSDMAAAKALSVLHDYFRQQEFETEVALIVSSLEQNLRGMRLNQKNLTPVVTILRGAPA